jgi:hypothetical protein
MLPSQASVSPLSSLCLQTCDFAIIENFYHLQLSKVYLHLQLSKVY